MTLVTASGSVEMIAFEFLATDRLERFIIKTALLNDFA